jgi:hypothetical protein
MKAATTRDSFIHKKPNYSSRIIVSPNTTSNKNGQKIAYNRRGNSTESLRESFAIGKFSNDINDNDPNNLITQVPKGQVRPSTGGNLLSYPNPSNQQNQVK